MSLLLSKYFPSRNSVVLKTISAGVHRKSSLTMLLIGSRTSSKLSTQLIAVGLVCDAFNCLWNRSTRLLAHGWYAVVWMCWMLNRRFNSLKSFDWNCVPLSVVMTGHVVIGYPIFEDGFCNCVRWGVSYWNCSWPKRKSIDDCQQIAVVLPEWSGSDDVYV